MFSSLFRKELTIKETKKIFRHLDNFPPHLQDIFVQKFFKEDAEQRLMSEHVISDIRILYDALMNSNEECKFIFLNPFTNKYVSVYVDYKSASHVDFLEYEIAKRNHFKTFEIFIRKKDVIDNPWVSGNNFTSFKDILYHELAHCNFINTFELNKNNSEISADIASIVYIIKQDNLTLDLAKELIQRTIKMRHQTASVFLYVRGICQKPRNHFTESALILFNNIDEMILSEIKSLENSDIMRFVSFWLDNMKHLLKNPYSIDFYNKDLIKFLFYNNYESSLVNPNSPNRAWIRSVHMNQKHRKKMFKFLTNLPPMSPDEIDDMKDFYLLNTLINLESFNDFMTHTLLHKSFEYTLENLFNKDDYKYIFLDTLTDFRIYKDKITSTYIDIPIGYNYKDLNNFISKNNCNV